MQERAEDREQGEVSQSGAPRSTRTLPLGIVREVSPFDFKLEGNLTFELGGNERTVKIILEIKNDPLSPYTNTLSFDLFPTFEAMLKYLSEIKGSFLDPEIVERHLAGELALNLDDVSGFVGHFMALGNQNKQDIIEHHVKATEKRLADLLNLLPDRPKRTRSAWTRYTLEREVRIAIQAVRKAGGKITLSTVRDELRERHGDDAPASGEALRKQLDVFKIDWMTLKAEAKAFAKFRFSQGL
jgi:hypothetical protein